MAELSTPMQLVFDELNERLFEKAKASSNNNEQNRYFEGMTTLRSQQDSIQAKFLIEFQARLDSYLVLTANGGSIEDKPVRVLREELCLVDYHELEDDLAISILSTRREADVAEQLWSLNQRLSALFGRRPRDERDIPFSPVALSKVIQFAMRGVDVDDCVKTCVYQQFDVSVLALCDALLSDANALLAKAGLLPNLRGGDVREMIRDGGSQTYEARRDADIQEFDDTQTVAQGQTAPAVTETKSIEPANDEGPLAQQGVPQGLTGMRDSGQVHNEQHALDAIVQWQKARVVTGAVAITQQGVSLGELYSVDSQSDEQLASEDYVAVLNDIQQLEQTFLTTSPETVHSVQEQQRQIVGALKDFACGRERRKVSATHAQTIDLVGIIFSELLNNEGLNDRVKALLSHLHTPYLKIALIDSEFLSCAVHPARALLNELAEAACRWIDAEQDTFRVFDKIYQVVHRVIDEYDDDISLIEALQEDFDNYCTRLTRRVELAEKRNAQVQDGVDRLETAKEHASRIVARRVAARALPEASITLIAHSWTEFLSFVFLRYGLGSDHWQRAVVMLNRAVVRVHASLLQGEPTSADKPLVIIELDEQLKNEILSFGYAQSDAEQILELLDQASMVNPGGQWFERQNAAQVVKECHSSEPIDADLEGDIKLDFEHHELDDSLDAQERELGERLQVVKPGCWFEWVALDGTVEKRLKLAWSNMATGRYMFVDQVGSKNQLLELNELTRQVHRGRIRVSNLEQKGFLERIFDGFIDSLRATA